MDCAGRHERFVGEMGEAFSKGLIFCVHSDFEDI